MAEINLNEFKKLKNKTKEHYNSINEIYSPALKSKIVFNSDGFHHLRYDSNRSERNKKLQMGKFRCFNDAVNIIEKSNTIQEYRRSIISVGKRSKDGFSKTKTVEWFSMFAIVSFSKKVRVNVIIRRTSEDKGKFHFWSVMPFGTISNNRRVIGKKDIEDK
jgi:hypothetical protein